jgi:hypothetical protein
MFLTRRFTAPGFLFLSDADPKPNMDQSNQRPTSRHVRAAVFFDHSGC